MADRMRGTSFIGGTDRVGDPDRTLPQNPCSRFGYHSPPCASNPLTCPLQSTTTEPVDEYTRRPAPSPVFLRQIGRHRAVGGPALAVQRFSQRQAVGPC